MTSFAQTRSIELKILGEKLDDWREGLLHAAKWARSIQHARKAFPSLDKDTLFITQCTAPGALGTLNSLIRGRGETEVAEEYPDTLDLRSGASAAVAARTAFHDNWFTQVLQSCSISEQIQLVRAIEELPFPTPKPGDAYSMREVAPYTAALQALFEPLPADLRESMTSNQETRDAVYRKLPISIRNLIKNLREHSSDDFEDTWITICDRLAECATLAEKAERVVAAFAAPRPSAPKRVYDSTRPAEPQAKRLRDNSLDAKDESSADTAVVETITCVECNARFNFTEGEERFFKEKNWSKPLRCKSCREKRKDLRVQRQNDPNYVPLGKRHVSSNWLA